MRLTNKILALATTALLASVSIANAAEPLALSGNFDSLTLAGVNEGNTTALSLTNGAYSGNDLFISLSFQIGSFTPNETSSTGRSYEDFVGLWLDTATTGNHTGAPNIGFKGSNTGDDALIRLGSSATDTARFGGSVLNAGESFTILAHLYKTAGSSTYNAFEGWFNPTVADTSNTADVTLTKAKNTGLSSISYIGVRSNLDATDSVTVSNLKVGSTFAEVSPVPEASNLAMLLAGLGMMGFIARRRIG